MREWAKEVRNIVDNQNNRSREIDNTLFKLTQELSNSPFSLSAKRTQIGEWPLAWEVEIAKKKFIIREAEIAEKQKIYNHDDWGQPIDIIGKRDLVEVLQEIIVENMEK
ncbi:hypothetical protein [Clostridium thermarum]|uniref:hypothetical protein n=1 Tax=Clostridium thermarum TaxID=1716543 RepID=UPI001121165F|nr:hypothetical protein [Clostridium thermarum]